MKEFTIDTPIKNMKLKIGELVNVSGRVYQYQGILTEVKTKYGIITNPSDAGLNSHARTYEVLEYVG